MIKVYKILPLFAALFFAKETNAQNLVRHYKGNLVKWEKNKIFFCLDSSTLSLPGIEEYTDMSISTWSKIESTPTIEISNSNCDVTLYYKLEVDDYNIPPLGTNLIHFNDSGVISWAKINVNSYYNNQLGDAKKNNKLYDVPSILAHEIGHILGLNEDLTSEDTVMNIVTRRGSIYKRNLSKKDILNIKYLYN